MKEITEADRSTLQGFFGGYFHQDFALSYASWENAVSQYLKEAGEKDKKVLIEALERLHDSDLGEKKIEKLIMEEFFCFVWPTRARGRLWIQMILEMLRNEEPIKTLQSTRYSRSAPFARD